jgi:hypothetical protein
LVTNKENSFSLLVVSSIAWIIHFFFFLSIFSH